MTTETSQKLFERAQQHLPGGVDSPVRAFKSVEGTPRFIVRAKGQYIYDADGNCLLDYVGTWGPAILGHANPHVMTTLYEAMKNGLSFGAPTPKEIELAELVKERVPSVELIRFVNSGTEATMSAIRVARGFTGKDKIIKFDGNYHGHADYLLTKAGSGAATCGVPDSAGVPKSFTEHTVIANYNDLDSVKKVFQDHKDQVAAIIVEPVMGNMGCIKPEDGFLQGLRKLCDENKTVLIFDEVMTGFRVHKNCAQGLFDVVPDLTCFGKIIGGGLPVGAYGGKKEIMEMVAPLGPVYQAGTLSGNPLAMAVGCKTLELLTDSVYDQLDQKTKALTKGMADVAQKHAVSLQVTQVGSMFGFFFSEQPVKNAEDARQINAQKFKQLFHYFLDNDINLAPSPFEAGFVSANHTHEDIQRTIEVFDAFLSL